MKKLLVLLSALVVLWFGGCNQPAGPADYTPPLEQEEPAEPPSSEPIEPPEPPEGEPEPQGGEEPPIEPPEPPALTRTVTVDMYTFTGNGWTGNAALRIVVNGEEKPDVVKVHTTAADNTPADQLYRNTYTLTVTAGDTVQVYWVAGLSQGDYSFIAYYTDTPPIPAFSTDQKGSVLWNGANALLYRTRGYPPAGLYKVNDGTLLGEFTVIMPDDREN